MADSDTGRWVSTYATDLRPGDKIRIDGAEARLVARDYPGSIVPVFTAVLAPGRIRHPFRKTDPVEIWDPPDGSVSERVQLIGEAT